MYNPANSPPRPAGAADDSILDSSYAGSSPLNSSLNSSFSSLNSTLPIGSPLNAQQLQQLGMASPPHGTNAGNNEQVRQGEILNEHALEEVAAGFPGGPGFGAVGAYRYPHMYEDKAKDKSDVQDKNKEKSILDDSPMPMPDDEGSGRKAGFGRVTISDGGRIVEDREGDF